MKPNIKHICIVLLFVLLSGNLFATAPVAMAADTGLYQRTLCSPMPVLINNNPYTPANPSGIEIIPGGAANGMDSVFRVNLTFTTPSIYNYTATICENDTVFVHNSPYFAGKDSGTETIVAGAASGCDSIINVQLTIRANPYFYLYDTLCPGQSLTLYGLTFDETTRTGLIILEGGSYRGCDSLISVALTYRQTWVFAGADVTVLEGDTVCLNIQAAFPPTSFAWSPVPPCGVPNCASFCTDTLVDDQRYELTYTDIYGCLLQDEIRIKVNTEHLVYAPNIIKMGAERPNDRFFLRADPGVVKVNHLFVFDRWGEPVFEVFNAENTESAYSMGWDGTYRDKAVDQGVYGWWAELEVFNGRKIVESGTITVIKSE